MFEHGTFPEEVVFSRLIRLNAIVCGLVTGFIVGLVIFVATNWLVLKGGPVVGPHLALLGQFFIGYKVTYAGSLVGFAYGLLCGFLAGFFIAWVHNWFAALRGGRSRARP
jgi:fructose-specific phosphotransferase system IIC component